MRIEICTDIEADDFVDALVQAFVDTEIMEFIEMIAEEIDTHEFAIMLYEYAKNLKEEYEEGE